METLKAYYTQEMFMMPCLHIFCHPTDLQKHEDSTTQNKKFAFCFAQVKDFVSQINRRM
jgi:hypothetical protein